MISNISDINLYKQPSYNGEFRLLLWQLNKISSHQWDIWWYTLSQGIPK